VPNQTELATISGMPVTNEEDAEKAARHLVEKGIRTVIVTLALQLHFSFEVSASGFGLVCASPQRPCEDVGGLDASLCEFGGDAADFLD
jgi:pyridoxal/pyridoxine/pyridoxamine kinase